MKKVIILQHNGGQLANQLWFFAGVYAYCLEKGYECRNYSFFEYSKYFDIPVKNKLIEILFFKTYKIYSAFLPFRVARKIGRIFYKIFVFLIKTFKKDQVLYGGHSLEERKEFYYLPPTKESEDKLKKLEKDKRVKTIYMEGWLIRNPKGLLKFHNEVVRFFKIKKENRKKVDSFIGNLREKYDHIVGVHIRQKAVGDGDLEDINGKKVYIFPEDMKLVVATLKEYLLRFKRDSSQTCFVICSN